MNFNTIESVILERRMETHAKGIANFMNQNTTELSDDDSSFNKSPLSQYRSKTVISKLFLSTFLSRERFYLKEIENIFVGRSISYDHTFQVVANIGYTRQDNVWITQYNSLFLHC